MTRFIPLIDGNNKSVLQWTMIDKQGVETSKSVPRALWKQQNEWDEQEIHDFFNYTDSQQTAEEKEVEEEFNLEDKVEELEEEIQELKEHIEKKSSLDDY